MPAGLTRVRERLLSREVAGRLRNDPGLRVLRERCTGLNPRQIAAQPIDSTRFVVIDTETTGLHVYSGDEIVSIAMLELQGLAPTGREFNSLVNPRCPISQTSVEIHGIRDVDVKDAPDMDGLIGEVIDFIGEGVIVGHHINFDLRFLNKTLHRMIGCKLRNPWLDTMLLYLGHSGRIGHYTLEEVAQHCKVPVTERHTARGDALTTANIFAKLADQFVTADQPTSRLINHQQDNEYI
jgi:DNA polymerase-3 subunit epsilon